MSEATVNPTRRPSPSTVANRARPTSGKLEVRIFRDIREIEASDWDSILDHDDLQMSHRFIRTCQEARIETAEYWHLMLYQQDTLCCVASLCRFRVSLEVLSKGLVQTIIRMARRVRRTFLDVPVLFCGLPVSFGQPCIKIRRGADVTAVVDSVIAVMEDVARETRTRFLCLKEFDPDSAEQLAGVCRHGYFEVPSLPSCSLPLPWKSFDEYLRSMRAGYRRQISQTLKMRTTGGLDVRILDDFSARSDAIFGLYEQVIDRAEHRLERLNRAFIEQLDWNLQGQSRAIVIERLGEPLAVAILILSPSVTTFLLAGIDYRFNREHQAYPNLIAEVVAEAIRSGASRLEMGQTSYAIKSRMGAEQVPRCLFVRHRSAVGHSLLRSATGLLFPKQDYPNRRVFVDERNPVGER